MKKKLLVLGFITASVLLVMPHSKKGILAAIVFCLLAAGWIGFGKLDFSAKWRLLPLSVKTSATLVCCSAMTWFFPQWMLKITKFKMGPDRLIAGILIVAVLIWLLTALTGRFRLSITCTMVLVLLLSTSNAYIYSFRGIMLEPVDILSIRTAMNVMGNYSLFPIPTRVLQSWLIAAVFLIWLWCVSDVERGKISLRIRGIFLTLGTVFLLALYSFIEPMKTYHWEKQGAEYMGYVLDFAIKCKEIKAKKPENYSPEQIAELASGYEISSEEVTVLETEEKTKTPHIIVIMNESFADLSILNEMATNTEVIPFVSSLKENVISGYALASVFGGNTANSEYEFLTGNSMAWLPTNTVPYQQYVRDASYSMVSYLKNQYDYTCIAMHPYFSSGWNRVNTYTHFGFDEQMFLEDFPMENFLRKYVSDQEMYEEVIRVFEEKKESPLFLFGITMQNHGGYTYKGDDFEVTVSLEGYEKSYPEAEQYLSCIHESDWAVQILLEYFEQVEEDVVIVFFGDHFPGINDGFYNELDKGSDGSLDAQMKRFQVPFFIWANYGLEEQEVECTSLNYLSNYLYQAANIALPAYNQFLDELEEVIPAMNSRGYYSKTDHCFKYYDQMEGVEAQMLLQYEQLQYNSLFDKKNRNELLFPVVNSEIK